MAKIWMQAITNCTIDVAGQRVTKRPADWFECGKHQARILVANGSARFANLQDQDATLNLADCGIAIGMHLWPSVGALSTQYSLSIVSSEAPQLPFTRTLLLELEAQVNPALVPVGFAHLEAGWQVAVPVCADELLAEEIGSDADREATRQVVKNLTVPVYDTRAIFIARCSDTIMLVDEWIAQMAAVPGGDRRLAFLRACYRCVPLICHLPAERWMK